MTIKGLMLGVVGACLLGAAAASAQDANGNAIGPPQLRDFTLTPKQTIVTQPRPDPQRPPVVAPPPPANAGAPAARPQAAPPQRAAPATARETPPPADPRRTPSTAPVQAPSAPPPPAAGAPPAIETPPPPPPAAEAPPAEAPVAEPPAAEAPGLSPWLIALPVALLALLGFVVVDRRRRRADLETEQAEDSTSLAAAPVTAAAPRPDPVPRPWLELELKTMRASFTETEAVVQFELTIANTGGSPARNLRIDVKMFNAGNEQDQAISGFFRTAGRDQTRLSLPGIAADQDGVIQGEVGMPIEEMKAMQLDGRMLFVPVIAVNTLYDWGEERSGQTSKSYVVGRELETPSDKMGAFRVDQGPRIWRTVGQRQHSLARRI